jgi:hypothetical protein
VGSDGCQAAIAGGRDRRHLVHPHVPRRELTGCNRCADHKQARCLARMHRTSSTTRPSSSGPWTLRGRRRLSAVRTTPEVALSKTTPRQLARLCRRADAVQSRVLQGFMPPVDREVAARLLPMIAPFAPMQTTDNVVCRANGETGATGVDPWVYTPRDRDPALEPAASGVTG